MGQKIKPHSLRLGIIKDWDSKWFPKKMNFKEYLEEDLIIRKAVMEKIIQAGVEYIGIERSGATVRVTIRCAKPGLVIGKGGKGVEELIKTVNDKLNALRKERGQKEKIALSVNIEELRRMDVSAKVISQTIASSLERRMPFRMVVKKNMEQILQYKGVKGAKIVVSGRLNGAEIARTESMAKGKVPLQTLRANIDYGQATAFTTYGTIGIKVWINKGEVFDEKK